ncbi:MAG: hypothetical protein Q7S36_00140 [Candidatus Liptonbacteria bacterium]|nr:hypothetical protein [Candidatus Liptonbacteria bacterium]
MYEFNGEPTPDFVDGAPDAGSSKHLPKSSLEVKIRTMATDSESLAKGGEFSGVAKNISFSAPRRAKVSVEPIAPPPLGSKEKSKILTYVVLGVLGVVALFALGYFIPKLIAGQ